jgi:hypothetical protein
MAKQKWTLKRVALALSAAAMSFSIAHATITGTWSEKQDENASIGQLMPGMGTQSGSNTPSFNNGAGIITTASLSTAAGGTQNITLTNTRVVAGDAVVATLDANGSTGQPVLANVTVTAGQIVFTIQNIHATVALNAAVKIYFLLLKQGNSN